MGIRFHCSDCGQLLNIKSHLAGRRGFCPHCKAKLTVPDEAESEPGVPPSRTDAKTPRNQSSRGEVAEVDVTERELAQQDGISQSGSSPSASVSISVESSSSIPMALPVEDWNKQSDSQDVQNPSSRLDPIDQSPQSRWFVRPVSGGQFGPASGSLMRQWLQESRVGLDSYVWREGWPEWQFAKDVFPQFQGQGSPATQVASELAVPGSIAKRVAYNRRRRRKTTVGITLLALATVAVFGLLIVLVMVLNGQRNAGGGTGSPADSAQQSEQSDISSSNRRP